MPSLVLPIQKTSKDVSIPCLSLALKPCYIKYTVVIGPTPVFLFYMAILYLSIDPTTFKTNKKSKFNPENYPNSKPYPNQKGKN